MADAEDPASAGRRLQTRGVAEAAGSRAPSGALERDFVGEAPVPPRPVRRPLGAARRNRRIAAVKSFLALFEGLSPTRGSVAMAIVAAGAVLAFGGKLYLEGRSPLLTPATSEAAPAPAMDLLWRDGQASLLVLWPDGPRGFSPSGRAASDYLKPFALWGSGRTSAASGRMTYAGRSLPGGAQAFPTAPGLLAFDSARGLAARAGKDAAGGGAADPNTLSIFDENGADGGSARLSGAITALPRGFYAHLPVGEANGAIEVIPIDASRKMTRWPPRGPPAAGPAGSPVVALATSGRRAAPAPFVAALANGALRLILPDGAGWASAESKKRPDLVPDTIAISDDAGVAAGVTTAGDVCVGGARFSQPFREKGLLFARVPSGLPVAEAQKEAARLQGLFTGLKMANQAQALQTLRVRTGAANLSPFPSGAISTQVLVDPNIDPELYRTIYSPLLFTVENPLPLHCFALSQAAAALAVAADGSRLYLGLADGTIRVVSTPSPEAPEVATELFTLDGHDDAIAQLALSPDGDYLAAASLDGRVRVHDLKSAARLVVLPFLHLPTAAPRPATRRIAIPVATPAEPSGPNAGPARPDAALNEKGKERPVENPKSSDYEQLAPQEPLLREAQPEQQLQRPAGVDRPTGR